MTGSAVLADKTPFARTKRYVRLRSMDTAADRGSHCRSRLFVPRRGLVRSFVSFISAAAMLKFEGLAHACTGEIFSQVPGCERGSCRPHHRLGDGSVDDI